MFKFISKHKEKIYNSLIYILVFLFSVFPYSDSDWGWHYKYGEYFFTHSQILRNNIFSWSLPNFQWINPSWLYDPILYLLTKYVGFIGLSLLGGLVSVLTFYIIVSAFKLEYWKKAIVGVIFVTLCEVATTYGLRAQILTLLFLALLTRMIFASVKKTSLLFLIPILFLVWANIHGDFIFGFLVAITFFGFFIISDYINNKKTPFKKIAIYSSCLLSAFLLTFVNPFGYKIYLQSSFHITNPYLQNVLEWDPTFDACPYCHPYTFIAYIAILSGIFIIYLRKKNSKALPFLILAIIFLYPAIQFRRFLPVFLIVTIPILCSYLEDVKLKLDKYKIENILFIIIFIICLEFNVYNRFTSYNLYNYSEKDYCKFSSGCSPLMASYLLSNPPSGKGFNFYDWGGYFIGKGEPFKIFVDGRMHVWTDKGYQPYGDYVEIFYYNDFARFTNYNFDWTILPNNSTLAKKLYSTKELGKWKLIYKDGESDYFIKTK